MLVMVGCGRGGCGVTLPVGDTVGVDAKEIEESNRAVGLMGQFEFEKARTIFANLGEKHPNWLAMQVNLAMATLNRQQEGDSERAMKLLDEVIAQREHFLEARYCKGLLLLNGGKAQEALGEFRYVAEHDPKDAYAQYYIGQCLAATQKPAEALTAYEKAIAIDSSLRSAYYGAFQALQQMGKAAEAKDHLARFTAMKDDPRARLVEFKYTRMGKKAEAMVEER